MTRDNFVFCDLCYVPMGQLWNQPAVASDLLPPPDFHVCDDCFQASEPVVNDLQTYEQRTA